MDPVRLHILLFTIGVLPTISGLSQAQLNDQPTVQQSSHSAVTVSKLVSEPRHLVKELAQRGVTFGGMFVNDYSKGLSDSADSGHGVGRYSFDFSATLDGKRVFGWNGSTGFVRVKNHINEFGKSYDGAAQLFSNIDAASRTNLYELWFEQKLRSNKLRFKFGKIDANSEYAVVQNAGDFLNSSMGYSPTIMEFATYPEPKLGFNVFLRPIKNYGVNLGVFQTGTNGTFAIIEPGRGWTLPKGDLAGRASFGYWRRDGTLPRFDGGTSGVTQGFYSVAEQAVWRQPLPRDRGERTLSTFFQFGHADGQVSSFTRHIGGGSVLQAPLAARPHDSVGVAATWVHFSTEPNAGFDRNIELVMETYYKVTITKQITLVTDFQFLHNPGGLRANPDCSMINPRLVISF